MQETTLIDEGCLNTGKGKEITDLKAGYIEEEKNMVLKQIHR